MKSFTPITHMIVILLLVATWPVSVPATSYLPQDMLRETQTDSAVAKADALLTLFYGAVNGKTPPIEVGSIIPVYRENDLCKMVEVGKVRIVGWQQEFFITAVIIEGNVQPGDIARKNGFAAMISMRKSCGER